MTLIELIVFLSQFFYLAVTLDFVIMNITHQLFQEYSTFTLLNF